MQDYGQTRPIPALLLPPPNLYFEITRRRFLNRLLGLEIDVQNLLFDYFQATLSAEIRSAKAEGGRGRGCAVRVQALRAGSPGCGVLERGPVLCRGLGAACGLLRGMTNFARARGRRRKEGRELNN